MRSAVMHVIIIPESGSNCFSCRGQYVTHWQEVSAFERGVHIAPERNTINIAFLLVYGAYAGADHIAEVVYEIKPGINVSRSITHTASRVWASKSMIIDLGVVVQDAKGQIAALYSLCIFFNKSGIALASIDSTAGFGQPVVCGVLQGRFELLITPGQVQKSFYGRFE